MPAIFDTPHDAGLWWPRFAIDNLFPSGSHPGFYPRHPMLQISSAGFVMYSVRASVNVKCAMDFSRMPWDVQTCSLRMMALEGVDRVRMDKVNDSKVHSSIFQAQEKLDAMSSVEWECQSLTENAGSYNGSFIGRTYFEDKSFMELKIVLKRRSWYWIQTVIIPTFMLLAVLWASFFIVFSHYPYPFACIVGLIAVSA
eukprot:scaffold131593_cov60-Phaeocystis_antarctica.AAC.2